VSLDVIEHIEDDNAAIASMRDSLKTGGTLILSVPALSRLYGPKDIEIGHYRRYDRMVLLDVLSRNGFEPTFVRYWNVLGVFPAERVAPGGDPPAGAGRSESMR